MEENWIINRLSSLVEKYDEGGINKNQRFFSRKVDLDGYDRDAIEEVMVLLRNDNRIRTVGMEWPLNLFESLGFETANGITDRQKEALDLLISTRLTEKEALILLARYRDGKRYGEISEISGLSSKTLPNHIGKVISKLRLETNLELLMDGGNEAGTSETGGTQVEFKNRRLKLREEIGEEIRKLEAIKDELADLQLKTEAARKIKKAEDGIRELNQIRVEEMGLSKAAYHIVTRNGCRLISDLQGLTRKKLLRFRNCGVKSADEIIRKAAEWGIVIEEGEDEKWHW